MSFAIKIFLFYLIQKNFLPCGGEVLEALDFVRADSASHPGSWQINWLLVAVVGYITRHGFHLCLCIYSQLNVIEQRGHEGKEQERQRQQYDQSNGG